LGNTSYRISKIEQGRVLVEDAHGQPPTIPFWVGDAPGRSNELSAAVSELCEETQNLLNEKTPEFVQQHLQDQGIDAAAAQQAVAYLAAVLDALGCIPTRQQMVLERFFDDTGDMHLVIHAPLGSRIMRAWGLALRKRFCRHFNFELQAAALEDSLILSLGETHSFDNDSIPSFLHSSSVRQVLIQALLDAPMFEARWRWNATIALAVQRMRNGQRLPPQWQRNQAEDLVAVIFPDQLACLENIRGEREIPDHPLVTQTINDCLHETMDIDGLEQVLGELEEGKIQIRCLDLTAPSPLAAEIINARPYAFLDDGEAENRRTRAISQNHRDLENTASLSIISVEAIEQVRAECWISPRHPDELHDGLLQLGFLTQEEFTTGCSSAGSPGDASSWRHWFQTLCSDMRASCVFRPDGSCWWVATERLAEFLTLNPELIAKPDTTSVWQPETECSTEEALKELLRSRLAGLGPQSEALLSANLGVSLSDVKQGLLALQQEGYAIHMAGNQKTHTEAQWCERRLLARIHRYSRERRRHASRPVSPAAYMRFMVAWHGLDAPSADLAQTLTLLEGWSAPLASWEPGLLQSRCKEYSPAVLDQQILSGQLSWFRPVKDGATRQNIVSATPISIVPRQNRASWYRGVQQQAEELPASAELVHQSLLKEGAMFTGDLELHSGLLRPQLEQVLATLVARGMVTSDAFSPLRLLKAARRGGRQSGSEMLGRWSAVTLSDEKPPVPGPEQLADICSALLRRYGVVYRAVLERESLLPPWRHLLHYLRRMEDRGEVVGGRFVDGFSGEQFALPEAVGLLRRHDKDTDQRKFIVIHACDPLNLGGFITPGVKTAAVNGNRILLCNGLPLARMVGEDIEVLDQKTKIPIGDIHQRLSNVRSISNSRTFKRN
jgi:ATP-dependent Lhr-like helicase